MAKASKSTSIPVDPALEIGAWEDLETLVDMLNGSFEGYEYRLEPVKNKKNLYMFIEDPIHEDEYECGLITKKSKKAYAFSDAVHTMVMNAYQRYVEEFGEA